MDDFAEDGIIDFDSIVDRDKCRQLLANIKSRRSFTNELFLTEKEYLDNPQHKGVNPIPGRNLLEAFDNALGFIEENPTTVTALTHLLGPGYQILDKKIVCGTPELWLPEWLVQRIRGNPVNNLGAYVRPEYRDITYFYGIDFHQDIIDWPNRSADFLTLYVYLHPVTIHDAPLYVLPGSHRLGATVFPHSLTQLSDAPLIWRYTDGRGGIVDCRQRVLIGDTGYVALWHPCTLHGTQPDTADKERISLRYLFAKAENAAPAGVDVVNTTLRGLLTLVETRQDLEEDGTARLRRNIINTLRSND